MNPGAQSRVVLNDQLLLFGPDAAGSRLAAELADRGWRRVALFSGASAVRTGLRDRIRRQTLGRLEVVVVEQAIAAHAPVRDSEAIAEMLRGEDLDALIAVGGGSSSDTAKAVALLLAEGGGLVEHCSEFEPPDRLVHKVLLEPKLPVVAVVTTLSGAEQTPGGGATTDAGIKRTFWDPQLACAIVCYDTDILAEVPRAVLVETAMNGLAHCAEGLYSRTRNPVSTAMALHGATTLTRGLLALTRDDDQRGDTAAAGALDDLAAGAALSGLVIANARVGLHHAICHVLGGQLGLPHGVANSIMLPHVLAFNRPITDAAQAGFAAALVAGGARPAGNASDILSELRTAIGAPAQLRKFGVTQDSFGAIARDTMQDRGLYFNPRPVDGPGTVVELLVRAW